MREHCLYKIIQSCNNTALILPQELNVSASASFPWELGESQNLLYTVFKTVLALVAYPVRNGSFGESNKYIVDFPNVSPNQ